MCERELREHHRFLPFLKLMGAKCEGAYRAARVQSGVAALAFGGGTGQESFWRDGVRRDGKGDPGESVEKVKVGPRTKE